MNIHGYTQHGAIDVTIDGTRMTVPDDMGNRHRQMIAEWEEQGNTIPDFVPPPIDVAEVKAEAGRRIEAIMKPHQQANFQAQFAESVIMHGPDVSKWPENLQQTLSAAMSKWAEIKRLRTRSDEIEQMDPIPADFRNDSYWENE